LVGMVSSRASRARWVGILMVGAAAVLLTAAATPVHSALQRLAILTSLLALWALPLLWFWRSRRIRATLLFLPVLPVVLLLLPGGRVQSDELRNEYVRNTARFEGSPCAWGGENARGIDCSGLPRRALRHALLAQGIKRLDGAALRSWLEHWFFDASAKALAEGCRSYVVPLGVEGLIESLEHDGLQPGDLAITTDRLHVLVYRGGGLWIQAEPGIGRVLTLHGRQDENLWFRAPVSLYRWTVFAEDLQAGRS
jgi:hypothetical protein